MKEIIADLREVETDDEVSDHPARVELESLLHDYKGKVIRIRITEVKVKHKEA